MLPHVQHNATTRGDPAPSSVTPPSASSRSVARQGVSLILGLLGVAAAFLGGTSFLSRWSLVGLFATLVWGVVAGALLRSWWALLVVPVAAIVGYLVGSGINLQDWAGRGFEDAYFLAIYPTIPMVLGVAFGTPLGKRIEQVMRR